MNRTLPRAEVFETLLGLVELISDALELLVDERFGLTRALALPGEGCVQVAIHDRVRELAGDAPVREGQIPKAQLRAFLRDEYDLDFSPEEFNGLFDTSAGSAHDTSRCVATPTAQLQRRPSVRWMLKRLRL